MNALVRPFSLSPTESVEAKDRRTACRGFGFVPPRNFGGVSAHFGVQALHHFFGPANTQPRHVLTPLFASRSVNKRQDDLRGAQKVNDLHEKQKTSAADYVDEAAQWAAELTDRETEKVGNTKDALRVVSRKTGVASSMLWSLRYRKPKDLAVSIYMKIRCAYEAEIVRQKGLLAHELELTRLKAGSNCAFVVEAQTALDALDGSGR